MRMGQLMRNSSCKILHLDAAMLLLLQLCGIGWDTAHRDLSELMQKGILKREGKGRATHYRMIIG